MRSYFFPILFMVSVVASGFKFGGAETNPSSRLHAKDDDNLRTANAQDNLSEAKEVERNWIPSLRMFPRKKSFTAADEAFLEKANAFMASGKTSNKLSETKVREMATYATSNNRKWNIAYNVLGLSMFVTMMFMALVFGWRPYTP